MFFVRGREASYPFLPAEPPVDASSASSIAGTWSRVVVSGVVGMVVATQKPEKLALVLAPFPPDDTPRGAPIPTIDWSALASAKRSSS